MQQVLPVSLALVERVRRGGPAEAAAAFASSGGDAFDALRQEGEPAASRLRAQLDQVSPGLGNPVMAVRVREVERDSSPSEPSLGDGLEAAGWDPDPGALPERLLQIGARLAELERRLQAGT